MQQADFTRFRAVMAGMAEVYQRDLSGPLLDAYWLALAPWSLAEFEAASARLMATAKFMPRPADFHELRKAGRPTAGEAWQIACGTTDDPLIVRARHIATQGRYLGHIDLDELKWVQRRFCEVYDELQDVTETRQALPHLVGMPPLLDAPVRGGLSKL
jgi:hypothetical protein